MSLCHTVHFCYTQGWLVLHIPDGETKHNHTYQVADSWLPLQEYKKCLPSFIFPLVFFNCTAHNWVKNCKELLPSSYNTSRFDQPLQATEWLRNFRITNEHFLSKVMIFMQCVFYIHQSQDRIYMVCKFTMLT